MGCACKNGENKEIDSVEIEGFNYLVRVLNFLLILILMIAVTPIIFIGVLVLVFNQTILNKKNKMTDIIKVLLYFKDKFFNNKENDIDEFDDDNEFDDLEIIGLDRIENNNEKL